MNGDDPDRVIDAFADHLAHVQIADAPGRHQPGTGTLDLDAWLGKLAARGHAGFIALESKPSGNDGGEPPLAATERRARA